ncbi:hypothetical protein WA171_000817 [Blastocystis sp. BT1]
MKEVAALVMSLSITNDKRNQGIELIKCIRKNWEVIHEEVKQTKSDKRRTFGKEEGEIVDKLAEICNYRCDSRNRETVNRIMTRLGYFGYVDKPRFRQRMENCLKKRRLQDKNFHPSTRKPKDKAEKGNRRMDSSKRGSSRNKQVSVSGTPDALGPKYLDNLIKDSPDFEENVRGLTIDVYGPPCFSDDIHSETDELLLFPDDIQCMMKSGMLSEETPMESLIQCAYERNKEAGGVIEDDKTMEYKDPSTEDMGGWFPFSIDDPNQN